MYPSFTCRADFWISASLTNTSPSATPRMMLIPAKKQITGENKTQKYIQTVTKACSHHAFPVGLRPKHNACSPLHPFKTTNVFLELI